MSMIKKVDPKVDFVKLEHEMLAFWEKNDIFKKRVAANIDKPKWSFIDGPITANNPMGVHHAWGRTLKDIYNRHKAMTGHELRYQNGFDCQGLWVEVEVEKELGFKTKKDVEKHNIENFVNLCKERVRKYSSVQTKQSKRLGMWMDWDNSYFTMSDENNYTIWTFLKKLFDGGKIYRGTDVVPWSGRSGTSYSQMEIVEGRRLVAHKAIFVRFPLKARENEYLLVWTTTPWTLSSNVVVGVNVDLDYVKLQTHDSAVYYFAIDNLKFPRLEKQFKEKKQWVDGLPKLKTIAQIFKERGGYEIIGTIKGAQMVGWEYSGPFDELAAQHEPGGFPFTDDALKQADAKAVNQHRVIDPGKDSIGNDIVVAGEGTGIVHMAPGCGDIDHRIGKDQGLVNLAPLDEESKFIDKFGWLTGKSATDPETALAIIADLKKRGLLVHAEDYPHVYPHCWRSGDELVFRLVDEWYINMDWRNKIKKIVDDIEWIPEWGRDREHEWLDNMGDWMISKKRFWGLALPIWTFADGSFYVVGAKEELETLAVEGWDEFAGHSPHRPWIDKVKIKHPESGLVGERIKDVGNPWLDAGIVPYSTLKYTTDKDYWQEWFPGDFVTECFPGQFRNWFYSLLAMSAWLEEKAPFKTLLGHALVKDETGRDMHKSWGNAIWFDDAAERMGVDVMRWMYAAQNVEQNLLFGYHHADEVRKKLIRLWNSYSFYATYAAVDGFFPEKYPMKEKNRTVLDRWIIAKLNILLNDATSAYTSFRVDKFMRSFDKFLDDLSNWYIRRNRRRFWKTEDDADKIIAYHTLYEVLHTTIRMLAPCLPFVTENIYQNLVQNSEVDALESVHLCDFPTADISRIDAQLVAQVDALRKVVELGRSARNKANLKIRQPLVKLCYALEDDDIAEFIAVNSKVILEELNVKEIFRVSASTDLIAYRVKPNLPFISQEYGPKLAKIREAVAKLDTDALVSCLQREKSYALELKDETLTLPAVAFIVETESIPGFTSEVNGGVTVGLSTDLTPELLREGLVRDIIRHVQIMRKNAKFAVEDRIKIHGLINSPVGDAIADFRSFFCNETLAVELTDLPEAGEYQTQVNIQGQDLTIAIERV